MNLKNRDILHKYWFEDRYAEVMFDKVLDMFLVAMYFKTEHGMNRVATLPMITGQVKHSERYAEDAAENWVHGWPVELLPKEHKVANDN